MAEEPVLRSRQACPAEAGAPRLRTEESILFLVSDDGPVLGADQPHRRRLTAAVYAASEGLDTVVLEDDVPGGQAGTSSLIRNYPGFAHGISGNELAYQACEQAWLFGASLVFAQEATGLRTRAGLRVVEAGGSQLVARAVILAMGVSWRRLGVPSLEGLVGSGVFYGTGRSEARAMQGQDVFVVGGGNGAGQAALHLARYAARVTILIRGQSLAAKMSDYLVREIAEAPNTTVRPGVEVIDGSGQGHLETLTLRNRSSGETETVDASALFVMIGAEPCTDWLAGGVERDAAGFVLTGNDLVRDGRPPAGWPLQRAPLLLETRHPRRIRRRRRAIRIRQARRIGGRRRRDGREADARAPRRAARVACPHADLGPAEIQTGPSAAARKLRRARTRRGSAPEL